MLFRDHSSCVSVMEFWVFTFLQVAGEFFRSFWDDSLFFFLSHTHMHTPQTVIIYEAKFKMICDACTHRVVCIDIYSAIISLFDPVYPSVESRSDSQNGSWHHAKVSNLTLLTTTTATTIADEEETNHATQWCSCNVAKKFFLLFSSSPNNMMKDFWRTMCAPRDKW